MLCPRETDRDDGFLRGDGRGRQGGAGGGGVRRPGGAGQAQAEVRPVRRPLRGQMRGPLLAGLGKECGE